MSVENALNHLTFSILGLTLLFIVYYISFVKDVLRCRPIVLWISGSVSGFKLSSIYSNGYTPIPRDENDIERAMVENEIKQARQKMAVSTNLPLQVRPKQILPYTPSNCSFKLKSLDTQPSCTKKPMVVNKKKPTCVDKAFSISENNTRFGTPRSPKEVVDLAELKGCCVINMDKTHMYLAIDFHDEELVVSTFYLMKDHITDVGDCRISRDSGRYKLITSKGETMILKKMSKRKFYELYSSTSEIMSSGHSLLTIKDMMKLYDELSKIPETITISVYNNLISKIPARVAAKLRLKFDSDLVPRLAHLINLLKTVVTGFIHNGVTYRCIDVEGMSGVCTHDMVDAVYISDGKVLYVDFTSDVSLLKQKSDKIKEYLSSGAINIDMRMLDSSQELLLGDGFTQEAISQRFNPDVVRKISLSVTNKRPYHESMHYANKFSEMYNTASETIRSDFDSICDEISNNAADSFMESLSKKQYLRATMKDKNIVEKLKSKIIKCFTSNGVETAEMFEEIFPTIDTMDDPEVRKAIEFLKYTESNVHIKDRLEMKLRVPELSNKSLIEKLDGFSDESLMCNALSAIMKAEIGEYIRVTADGESFTIQETETSIKKSKELQKEGELDITCFCEAHKTGNRSFIAIFNEYHMHENFRDYVARMNNKDQGNNNKESMFLHKTYKELEVDKSVLMSSAMNIMDGDTQREIADFKALESIKVLKLLSDKTITSGPDDIQKTYLMSNKDFMISDLSISSSHDAVESKGIAISTKVGSRGMEYFIADNKPFNSVTLVKKGADTCHAKTIWYQTYYRSYNGKFKDNGFRSKSRNDIIWNIKLPYVLISMFDYAKESGASKETAFNDCMIAMINRDPATVMMLKVRYLYMSIRGEKSKPGDTFAKALDLTRDPIFKSGFENLYMVRMIKMFICGWCLNITASKGNDQDGKRILECRSQMICLPNMETSVASYDYHVSSFYVARAFNKFRTEKTASDSNNYLALIEELEIFEKSIKTKFDTVVGLDMEAQSKTSLNELVSHLKSNKDVYEDSLSEMMKKGPQRYSHSLIFFHSCIMTLKSDFDFKESEMIKRIFETNIADTFTMRGAMEKGQFKEKNQAVRAASAMYEHIVDKTTGLDQDKVTLPVLMNKMSSEANGLCSLYTLKSIQMDDILAEMLARIISKDQDGDREITVMNADMRIACKFCESVMEMGGSAVKENIMMSTNKETLFMNSYNDTIIGNKKKAGHVILDTNDQSRWGPNQLMNMFAHMATALIKDPYVRMMFLDTMNLMSMKKNKWPEALLKNFSNMAERAVGIRQRRTALGQAYEAYLVRSKPTEEYHVTMPMGMGQGILGTTSSIMHSAVCRWQGMFLKGKYGIDMTSYVTSDDSFCALNVPMEVHEMGLVQSSYVEFRSGTLAAANIIRNKAKSFVSSRDAEVNSIYIFEGNMIAPVGKFRSALIDCGDGINYYNDSMASISRGAEYIRKGGSIYGSYVMSAISVSLYMDQWRRFEQYNKNPASMGKPIEFGGIPTIQPICTMCFGPLSTSAIKLDGKSISTTLYAEVMSNSMIAPIESVTNVEMVRSAMPSINMDFYAPKSIEGVFSYSKFYKYEAAVEKRNQMSKLYLGDGEYPIDGKVMSFLETINYVQNRFKTKSLSDGSGHDFLDRMFEPAHSRDRSTIRIDDSSLVTEIFESSYSRLSLDEMEDVLDSFEADSISLKRVYRSFLDKSNGSSRTVDSLTEALNVAFSNSVNIAKDMRMNGLSKVPIPKSAIVANMKRALPAVSSLLVNERDVKLGVIAQYAGSSAVRYSACYGYEIGSTMSFEGNISDALLRAESVINSLRKHTVKGLNIFNRLTSDTSKYVDMVTQLFQNNYYSGHSLAVKVDEGVTVSERLFSLTESLRECSMNSVIYLSKVSNPGLIMEEVRYNRLEYTTIDGGLNHASEIIKSDDEKIVKEIKSIKDLSVYKNVLAATRSIVEMDSSVLTLITSIKASMVGYMGTTISNFAFQGVVKWKQGRSEGTGLVVTNKVLNSRSGGNKHVYTTTLFKIGGPKNNLNLEFNSSTVRSKFVKSIVEKYNNNSFRQSITDKLDVVRLDNSIRGEFHKFGDMFAVNIKTTEAGVKKIPIMRDYEAINLVPDFKMTDMFMTQADSMIDTAEMRDYSSVNDIIEELSYAETHSLTTEKSVELLVNLSNIISRSRKGTLTHKLKTIIKRFVSMRTLTRENFFVSETEMVSEIADAVVDEEEDEFDNEMFELLSSIASSKSVKIFDETTEVPSADEINRAMDRKANRNVGLTSRDVILSKMKQILEDRDIETLVQFILTNKLRFSGNYLFWVALDYMVNT